MLRPAGEVFGYDPFHEPWVAVAGAQAAASATLTGEVRERF